MNFESSFIAAIKAQGIIAPDEWQTWAREVCRAVVADYTKDCYCYTPEHIAEVLNLPKKEESNG